MEQGRYWLWRKRRHGLNPDRLNTSSANASYDDSWEEQAFAEDASGSLGGCVWPPRSYSCSFCGREFRSAQALGGHMNVHRRDRARLKQSPTPHDEQVMHQDIHNRNQFLPMGFQFQPENFVYNPNPNTNHATLPSTSKQHIPEKDASTIPGISINPTITIAQDTLDPSENLEAMSSNLSPKLRSNLVDVRSCEEDNSLKILESGCRVKGDHVQTDLSISLNLVVGCKRKRNDYVPFFLKPIAKERRNLQGDNDVDDIDLELRLGEPPKVK